MSARKSPEPADLECALCPRLVALRREAEEKHPDWHNNPVPAWGAQNAKMMIVGMAPGMGGANRTGRPFTGDHAGDLLFATLRKAGLTRGTYDRRPDDGLELIETVIANVVRCVPPQNKPVADEVKKCRPYILATLETQNQAKTFFALGRIAHDAFLTTLELRRAAFPFSHGGKHNLGDGRVLFDSYHCSRYNTNTRVLTTEMFETAVFSAAKHAQIGRWADQPR